MPEAVRTYAETKNLSDVRNVQDIIIRSYYADFAKHIPAKDIAKVRLIWESVPIQLGKENKRFLYSDMKHGSRGRDYETALKWLEDAGLVLKLNRVSLPNMPLAGYKELFIFKLYMPDIGLLSARTALELKTYLENDEKLFNHYKGLLAEQFVFQELVANNENMPIFYWSNQKNTAEIEFIIQYDGKIIPVEVKSGKNVKSKSLKRYTEEFKPAVAVRISLIEYAKHGSLYDIPLYMTGKLTGLLNSGK
jgi:predicted AAA+ superfamily ATPase